ncbi:TonB-dependent receptor plug domain-containing protein [Erythrobacter dokdonensis]|uniref:Outer membrane receptor protein n=1 Tax=Erythrobacter dokdonensis DSW-74 TaxID=1300349 RepID=A0A1A7BIP2_9SPHN|nr:TonB-dependent receptor plug domain-containing protein [Erythrobacter dokdonensis]OBV11581.1 Outer membrane receptor protein [Erythrobacter dokdonensis DSW-74]
MKPRSPFPRSARLSLVPSVILFGLTVPLAAQDELGGADEPTSLDVSAGTAPASTRSTFVPEDFVRFAPRSALDMARQVPGFAIREGDGARGLGQADINVLINGRRISGKSNGPLEALGRIPFEDVVRLELVDGASLDIGGLTGQVLNVVTESSGRISGQFRYSPQVRSFGTPARLLNGSIALAGGGPNTDWTLALENDSQRRGNEGLEQVFDATGALVATRDEKANFNSDRPSISGSFTRTAQNANILNLSGQVQGFLFRETEVSRQSLHGAPVDRVRNLRRTEDEFNFELGADYQFALGPGQLKLIAYHRYEDSPTTSTVITTFADGSPAQGSVFVRDADEAETILRSEYTFAAAGGNIVAALEAVRNFLEIDSTLAVRDGNGVLQPVLLPGASDRVEEDRADAGLTYSRALGPQLQLQISAGGEYSRISQAGPLGLTRRFWRPKGFAAIDWKAGKALNLAGRIERVVGQLDFFDFIATVDLDQDREDVTNANLVPQQSWVYELEASWRLGALGNLNLRGFYEDITDIVDQIPIPGGGQAPGNIPSAKRYGVNGNATLLSDRFGWKGTRLDLGLALAGSEVSDPLLGFVRELSGNRLIDLSMNLRHDVTGTAWAFGAAGDWRDNAAAVRLDEISLNNPGFAFVSAFVENKDVAGMTLRATMGNLLGQRDRFSRTVFTDRAAGLVAFSEARDRKFGTIFTVDVEGSF